MYRSLAICTGIVAVFLLYAGFSTVGAQQRETFTGQVSQYGSGAYAGLRTANFTLTINGMTSDEDAQRFLGILKTGGQDSLLSAIRNQDLGTFSLNSGLARTVNIVRETDSGVPEIYMVCERWEPFAEVRGGYRIGDYPFGVIQLTIDPKTGKGSGKYYAAAKISWKKEKNGTGAHVEIEDYATFPANLINVQTKYQKP